MGAISHPYQEPLHVWLGNPSRRRHHGCERAAGGAGNPEGLEEDRLIWRKLATRLSWVADTTGWSRPFFSLRQVSSRWSSSAGQRPAAPPSRKNSLLGFVVPRWRTLPARFDRTSFATCNWSVTGSS